MICPKCNGRGTVGYFHIDHFVDIECDRCHGSGEVPMTNEEWIKSLDTEQLARIIYELMWHKEKYPELCVYPVVDSVVEWLKQPHTTKE